MGDTSNPSALQPEIQIGFCTHDTGCSAINPGIISDITGTVDPLKKENPVNAIMNGVEVKAECIGCLFRCRSTTAAAQVNIGSHKAVVEYRSPEELQTQVSELLGRTPEHWAAIEQAQQERERRVAAEVEQEMRRFREEREKRKADENRK